MLAVVVLLLVFLGGSSKGGNAASSSDVRTPGFQFKDIGVRVFTTGPTTTQDPKAKPDLQKANQAAGPAVTNAKLMLHQYFTQAFLVPANWTSGSYDAAFTNFSAAAKAQAQQHLAVLTAGPNAGTLFTSIKPAKASLRTRVLLDAKNRPYAVACDTFFVATATKKSGGSASLVSTGSFTLQRVGNTWQIVSFKVKRTDQGVAATSTAAPSGSPS